MIFDPQRCGTFHHVHLWKANAKAVEDVVWMVYKVLLSSWMAKLQLFLLSQCQIFEGRIQQKHRYIVQTSIDFTFHWYAVAIFPRSF